MNQQELMREVDSIIEARLAREEPAPMSWIIQAVLKRHTRVSGDDRDFYVLCAHEHVHRTVHAALRALKAMEEASDVDQAELFPGMKRVQRRYPIARDGEPVVVLLVQMTDEEIRAKARELRQFAVGALAHAQELEEYLKNRQAAA